MSYQVLARKWRPATFTDLVGQDTVTRILVNSLNTHRLHPALIFSGPRGTGKTSTARILAKTLCCAATKNTTPCLKCKICQDIEHSRSLDVMEIDGASHNGVEAVRQITDTISHLPSGKYKIYIIDEAHMLSVNAFNALLKTLEEPPPHVIFILATTEMRKIPITVLSRCQVLPFHRIMDTLIYKQLEKICKQEGVETDEQTLWLLVREAGGSLRDGQGLLDQMITFCKKKFFSSHVNEILGLTDRSLVLDCMASLFKRNPAQMLQVLDQLHVKGTQPGLFLKNLIGELRNLLLLKLKAPVISHLISLSQKERAELLNQSGQVSSEDLHLLFDMALKGSWDITKAQDTKVFLEMLLLRMSQAPYVESFFDGGAEVKSLKPTEKKPPSPSAVTGDKIPPFVQKVQSVFKADIVTSSPAGAISPKKR